MTRLLRLFGAGVRWAAASQNGIHPRHAMLYFAVAYGMLLNVLFWGAGLALLLTPRPYRRYWLLWVAPAGLALQSAVVWFGAYLDLRGTDSYAGWTMVLPAALLAWALRSQARRREAWSGLPRFWGVVLIVALALGVMIAPLASASKALTTASLGSCDAADYAAGARVLKEFAHDDRTGFLGDTEVVRIQSVDNFFDFWLRLNHFTPSALVAFNATILGVKPHELVGLATAVLLVLVVPLVFWLARDVMRLGPLGGGVTALLYALGPVNLYAVYHVAMGQLLAAGAIALLTWAGVAIWREGAPWRRAPAWAGLLFVAYWLVLGSYNFIVIVCLVPAAAFAAYDAIRRDEPQRLVRWLVVMLAPLAVCSAVFAQRALGLIERFRLFRQYDFGWRIPAFSPEEWWGLVTGPDLGGHPLAIRCLASIALLAALAWALGRNARRRKRLLPLAACLTVPILAGYAFLEIRGGMEGTNASYDAYKLFSVFYPGILAALCAWLGLDGRVSRWLATGLAALVLAGNAAGVRPFLRQMQAPPRIVDKALVHLEAVEEMPQVDSINMLIPDFWSRLWANAFLLRKAQYFAQHTYEGRLNTTLRGGWDLTSQDLVTVVPPRPADRIALGPDYTLTNTRSPGFLRADLGAGWYEREQLPDQPVRWRWSRGAAEVRLENPHPQPVTVRFRLTTRSMVNRDLQGWLAGRDFWTGEVGTELTTIELPPVAVPPGHSVLELRSSQPPVSPGGGDTRKLGIVIYAFDVVVQGGDDAAPAVP